MKTILKLEADDCLQRAIDNGWSWDDFHRNAHDDYLTLRELALMEQNDECAYTGLWLGKGTTQTVHLDHFRKKAIYPELTFDWYNLFAAAKDLDYGSDYKDRNIHGPRDNADSQYNTFWSPLKVNLEGNFWYRQDGKIMPYPGIDEDARQIAQQTIDMYNLNADDLKKRRQGIIQLVGGLDQLDDDTVRQCMATSGFSFVVEFELAQRQK